MLSLCTHQHVAIQKLPHRINWIFPQNLLHFNQIVLATLKQDICTKNEYWLCMVQAASWYQVYLRELPSSLYLELLDIGTYSAFEYVIHIVGQPLKPSPACWLGYKYSGTWNTHTYGYWRASDTLESVSILNSIAIRDIILVSKYLRELSHSEVSENIPYYSCTAIAHVKLCCRSRWNRVFTVFK